MESSITSSPEDAPASAPHAADAAAVRAMPDVVRVFVNDARWWQNASFALPLIVSVLSLVAGLVTGRAEGIGFGLFAGVVTVIMIPVVLLTTMSKVPTVPVAVGLA